MFTGIIEAIGSVEAARSQGGGVELELKAAEIAGDIALGDSIAVEGVCQTITAIAGETFRFFAMGETLQCTTLGDLAPGAAVNLERALTPTSRLGGHFVTGHVDGVGVVESIAEEQSWRTFRLSMDEALLELLVPKGSLAVNGISLTVGPEILEDGCELFIIPHSLAQTTLGDARVGDKVNLETDILGKYVQRFVQLGESPARPLLGLLMEQGFMKGQK
jgi:riboflavin synthase